MNLNYFWVTLFLSNVAFSATLNGLYGSGQNLEYVCKNSKKPLALVIRKSHRCDNADVVKQCMEMSRSIMDSCNNFLNNFDVFHIRLGKYQDMDQGEYTTTTSQQQAWAAWDRDLQDAGFPENPGVVVVDTKSCKILENIFLYSFSFSKNRLANAHQFETLIRASISNVNELEVLSNATFQACESSSSLPDLHQVWSIMESQERSGL